MLVLGKLLGSELGQLGRKDSENVMVGLSSSCGDALGLVIAGLLVFLLGRSYGVLGRPGKDPGGVGAIGGANDLAQHCVMGDQGGFDNGLFVCAAAAD